MFEWLWLLIFPVAPVMNHAAPPEDYVGVVACEAAYASLLPASVEPKPKPPIDPKNCPTCKGTKRVPTGDSNNPWTKCPTCQPVSAAPVGPPASSTIKTPVDAPKQLFKKAPVQSVPSQSNCPGGVCPPKQQPQSAATDFAPVLVPLGLRRLFRRR